MTAARIAGKGIRQPTSPDVSLAWWRDALAGKSPQITQEPQCGFFRRKLVRGGPFVGARIWLHQEIDVEALELMGDEELCCEVDGCTADPQDQWLWLAGYPVTEEEFRYLTARRAYAETHAPNDAFATPTRAVDWLSITPTF